MPSLFTTYTISVPCCNALFMDYLGEKFKFPTVGWQNMLGNIGNLFANVCDKSQQAISTICWG